MQVNDWIEIKRDKDGFATEKCLNEMFENTLIVVARNQRNRVYYDVIKRENQEYWRGEIEIDKIYTHYMIIPEV